AIERLGDALDGFYIAGVRQNVAFLGAITVSERFRACNLSTDVIGEMFPHGFTPPAEPTEADQVLLAAAVLAELRMRASETAIDRLGREAEMSPELVVLLDGRACPVSVRAEGAAYRITG